MSNFNLPQPLGHATCGVQIEFSQYLSAGTPTSREQRKPQNSQGQATSRTFSDLLGQRGDKLRNSLANRSHRTTAATKGGIMNSSRRMTTIFSGLWGVLLLVVLTPAVSAQHIRGALEGTVSDANGAVVQGASVKIKSGSTGAETTAPTDERGRFN